VRTDRLGAISAVAVGLAVALIGSSLGAARPGSGKFTHPRRVENRWYPLRPGARYLYTGSEYVGGRRLAHTDVFIVTGLTKVIDGVRTVVVWDRDYDLGQLAEGELAFFAQDDRGTVWLFGEYPEEFSHGKVTGAPDTWITGIRGARRGIAMRADPRPGTPSYAQGVAPAIGFHDRARVYRTGLHNCVPVGCHSNVLETEEWSPDEPRSRQFKYYAPGIGNIRVAFAGGGRRESLTLRSLTRLSGAAFAPVNAQALAIDTRGRRTNKGVYGRTAPAVLGPASGDV
jgi:hypothetical protein